MKRMVIKGSEWQRGPNTSGNKLLSEDNTRCCVGIHARLCGIPDKDILDIGAIHSVNGYNNYHKKWAGPWMVEVEDNGVMEELVTMAYGGNDSEDFEDDEQRIEFLRPVFRQLGITIVWRPDL